jgi:hypothetical protein
LVAGLAMQWERTALFGALALFVPYSLAIIFFDVPRGLAHPSEFGAWYGVLENLALAAGALIICTFYARLEAATAERLSKIARVAFGICLIYFGLAHHFYLANTVSMVPAWLPPGQTFWAYATGACAQGPHHRSPQSFRLGRERGQPRPYRICVGDRDVNTGRCENQGLTIHQWKVGPDRYRIFCVDRAVVPPNSRKLALERTKESSYSCSNAWRHAPPARRGAREPIWS